MTILPEIIFDKEVPTKLWNSFGSGLRIRLGAALRSPGARLESCISHNSS